MPLNAADLAHRIAVLPPDAIEALRLLFGDR
jgi:hypothetical protein